MKITFINYEKRICQVESEGKIWLCSIKKINNDLYYKFKGKWYFLK